MNFLRITSLLSLLAVGACTGSGESAQPDPVPTEPTEPAPPQEPAPPTQPAEPPEQAKKEPEAPPDKVPYPGKTIVASEVDRAVLACEATDSSLSMEENRRACMQMLVEQTKDGSIVLVTNETKGPDCPTCVTMTAEASPVAEAMGQTQVLFMDAIAGSVECTSGATAKTREESRLECYQTLAKQGGSIGADVVFPLAIEEGGAACKACVSIVGTGYTAKVLRQP